MLKNGRKIGRQKVIRYSRKKSLASKTNHLQLIKLQSANENRSFNLSKRSVIRNSF